mmetsp:Transcript_38078/g.84814  ORF Transcript_38078/g.84814 Transcript_38078/m.84814 type:complete len:153 (+) Transcript_38078:78-536(+)
MAQAALGRAMVAAGGTMLLLGGATVAVSSVSMFVGKVFIDRYKKKIVVACPLCRGQRRVTCDVCQGDRVLKYHPFPDPPVNSRTGGRCACAMCEGSGTQLCLNCLGEGETYPTTFDWIPPPEHLVIAPARPQQPVAPAVAGPAEALAPPKNQ